MSEEATKCDTIIAQIKKLLYNYDLSITYAQGEIKFHECNMNLYANSRKTKEKAKFVSHKIDMQKYAIYIEELTKAKEGVLATLNSVLDKYNQLYKNVFYMKYFQNKQLEEIANETGYSVSGIKKIIDRMKNDFIDISL